MTAIALVLVALPAGLFVRHRRDALTVWFVTFGFLYPFQTVSVDRTFRDNGEGGVDWSYPLVNLLVLVAGIGIVALGARWRTRRAARGPVTDQSMAVGSVAGSGQR